MIETVGNKCTLLRRQGEKGSENVLLWGSKCGLGAQSETLMGVRASQPHPVVEGPFELREGEVVRFGDFLRALPKADEVADSEFDEEDFPDPQKPIV